MASRKFKDRCKSYSISLTDKEKEKYCAAFGGSISRTFRFLCELMERACIDGMLDDKYVQAIMKKHGGE